MKHCGPTSQRRLFVAKWTTSNNDSHLKCLVVDSSPKKETFTHPHGSKPIWLPFFCVTQKQWKPMRFFIVIQVWNNRILGWTVPLMSPVLWSGCMLRPCMLKPVWGFHEPGIYGENDEGEYILHHSVLVCAFFFKQNTIVNSYLWHVDHLQCTIGYTRTGALSLSSCVLGGRIWVARDHQ